MTTLLLRLYGWLLHLYPRNFYVEFGAEMQITFADAIAEASKVAVSSWRNLACANYSV